jgi:hypothetical protein
MIIRLFRQSYLSQYLLLLLLHGILWISVFIFPPALHEVMHPFLNPAYSLLTQLLGNNPVVYVVVGFIVVLASAIVFNHTLEKHDLTSKNVLIPALVLIFLLGMIPSLQTLHQAMIPGLIMIFVLNQVFEIYTREDPHAQVFYAGFLIAVSSMFYFPSIAFLLFVWFTFIVFSIYRWREWTIVVFGFLTPYILLWTYFFWTDQLFEVFQSYGQYFTPKAIFQLDLSPTVLNIILLSIVVLIFLRAFLQQTVTVQENIISVRKRFFASIQFLIIALAAFVFSGNLTTYHITFLLIAMAIFIQGFIVRMNRNLVAEIVFGILLVGTLINHFYIALLSL